VRADDAGGVELVWTRGRQPSRLSETEWLAERRRTHDEARAMAADLMPAVGAVCPEFNPQTSGDPPLRRVLSQRGAFGVDGLDRIWTLPSLHPDSLPRARFRGRAWPRDDKTLPNPRELSITGIQSLIPPHPARRWIAHRLLAEDPLKPPTTVSGPGWTGKGLTRRRSCGSRSAPGRSTGSSG